MVNIPTHKIYTIVVLLPVILIYIYSELNLLEIKPVNAISVKVSWEASIKVSTYLKYECLFKVTGAVLSQYEVVLPPNITSTETSVCVEDTVKEFEHKVTLQQNISSNDIIEISSNFKLGTLYFDYHSKKVINFFC